MNLLAPRLAILAVLSCFAGCSDAKKDEIATLLDRATKLEQGGQFYDAIQVYKDVAARELAPSQRAHVRFDLARCQIAGNDLNGAIATLEDLTSEDVKETQLDIGELYLSLGDKYFDKGDKKKAQIAWQMGRGVSPARVVTFNKRIEQLIPAAPEKSDDKK
jgi:tetratricopeptide (TPR) repeat protein